MTFWKHEVSAFGVGIMPSGVAVHDGYRVETDADAESRWRVTYEIDGKSVSHTFDMAKRWEARYGLSPNAELRPVPASVDFLPSERSE